MKNKGLTLIELLVATVMMSLVIAAIVVIFTASIRGQIRNLASQELSDQTSYVVEYISRALRMAKKDSDGLCTGDASLNYIKTHSNNGIKFLNYRDECQEFYWATTTDTSKLVEEVGGGSAVDLTSDELEVVSFKIGPNDSWDDGDSLQPRVTMFFDIKSKASGIKASQQPEIIIQATVSQRNLDQ